MSFTSDSIFPGTPPKLPEIPAGWEWDVSFDKSSIHVQLRTGPTDARKSFIVSDERDYHLGHPTTSKVVAIAERIYKRQSIAIDMSKELGITVRAR